MSKGAADAALTRDIFISYSHQDEAIVGRLRQLLADRGCTVWTFSTEDRKGSAWEQDEYTAMDKAPVAVFVITPAWLESNPCLIEFNRLTTDTNKPQKQWLAMLIGKPDLTSDDPGEFEISPHYVDQKISRKNWVSYGSQPTDAELADDAEAITGLVGTFDRVELAKGDGYSVRQEGSEVWLTVDLTGPKVSAINATLDECWPSRFWASDQCWKFPVETYTSSVARTLSPSASRRQ